MPTAYILVGVPGSGKSTWIAKQPWDWDKTVIASTDGYIEQQARKQGKTYNDVFGDHMSDAVAHMAQTVKDAVEQGLDIIWDQTNTTKESRAKKLRMLDGYKKVAIVFPAPDADEHERRLNSRPGKVIPPHVLDSMKAGFEMPSEQEGFDEIWNT